MFPVGSVCFLLPFYRVELHGSSYTGGRGPDGKSLSEAEEEPFQENDRMRKERHTTEKMHRLMRRTRAGEGSLACIASSRPTTAMLTLSHKK